jgi:hypothetical protein
VLSLERVRALLGPEAEGLSDDEVADLRDRARVIVREYIAQRTRPQIETEKRAVDAA